MQQCSALFARLGTASGLSATASPGRAAYNRGGDMGQRGGFVKVLAIDGAMMSFWPAELMGDGRPGTSGAMRPPLIVALAIIGFAAAFHLHWALGGRLGYSVSLPQRPDGKPVMAHRIGWWRWAAGGIAIFLILLAGLATGAAGEIALPLSRQASRAALAAVGAAFVLRALVPTPWTGFFKRIRSTRWARYDSRLYSPLFLLLGACLIALARGY